MHSAAQHLCLDKRLQSGEENYPVEITQCKYQHLFRKQEKSFFSNVKGTG